MTHYREILRLHALGFSQQNIAYSCSASKKTVNKVIRLAQENNLGWPLPETKTDGVLAQMFSSPITKFQLMKRMPSVDHIHRELMRKGVSKKLLWTKYLEECCLCNESPLMYSQFCYYIQQDEQKRRASMHIPRKPAEQVEVDWAGDPAKIIDPDTGELTNVYLFVGVMTYSQYAFVMAFVNEKQYAWSRAQIWQKMIL